MGETRDDGSGDEAPPAEAPDWEELAKRYLDLWQQHLTALSADPGLADQFTRMMQGMGAAAAANPLMAPMLGAWSGDWRTGAAAGAPAAGDASGERDHRLDELERRLAAVEARLDRLAGGAEDGG